MRPSRFEPLNYAVLYLAKALLWRSDKLARMARRLAKPLAH